MKQIHIECNPDETLAKKLGFTRKFIKHHRGKSTIFKELQKKATSNELAIVDEDPETNKTNYEKTLTFIDELFGIKYFTDKHNNKVFILNGKLEDWVIRICNQNKINITDFGLPNDPDELNRIINRRLKNFEKLLEYFLTINNPAILKLKSWLK